MKFSPNHHSETEAANESLCATRKTPKLPQTPPEGGDKTPKGSKKYMTGFMKWEVDEMEKTVHRGTSFNRAENKYHSPDEDNQKNKGTSNLQNSLVSHACVLACYVLVCNVSVYCETTIGETKLPFDLMVGNGGNMGKLVRRRDHLPYTGCCQDRCVNAGLNETEERLLVWGALF